MFPVCQFGRPADLTGSPAAGRAGQPGETSLLTRPQVFLACLASLIVVHCACMMFGFLAGKQNTLQIFQWQPSSATCHILMFMSSDAAIRYPCACRPRKAPANQELCSHPASAWPTLVTAPGCSLCAPPCCLLLQGCPAVAPTFVSMGCTQGPPYLIFAAEVAGHPVLLQVYHWELTLSKCPAGLPGDKPHLGHQDPPAAAAPRNSGSSSCQHRRPSCRGPEGRCPASIQGAGGCSAPDCSAGGPAGLLQGAGPLPAVGGPKQLVLCCMRGHYQQGMSARPMLGHCWTARPSTACA